MADLPVGEEVWISMVIRAGHLVPVRGDTRLEAGDQLLVLADPDGGPDPARVFQADAAEGGSRHPRAPG